MGDPFIKFELRVSEVASLAKKLVVLTAMLINISYLYFHRVFSVPSPQLLMLHSHRSPSVLLYFVN